MKRLFLTSSLAMLILVTPVLAQQAGTNVNVLPVVPELFPSDPDWDPEWDPEKPDPIWWKLGDGYLQRQVEPTIGASTLNPEHLLAFFNDYRAVDVVEGDVGLGEGEITSAALKLAALLLPPTISSALPKMELVPPINAAEAWIGGSRSYDGGYTWSGFFVPGAPWDDSPLSINSPIYGLEAATDPVLAPGPCGTFYLVFVAFTRGADSKLVVARYRDTNDFEGGDTIIYEGMTVVESGNNAEYGYFLDKPDIEVDIMRPADVDQCAHRVYASYSTFNGLTKDEKVQTKMTLAMSEDGGITFSKEKINKNFNQNQGSAIAVDPRPGTPKGTGGGTLYVFWRHFFDPHAIIWTRSLDYGTKWSAPAILTNSPALSRFDQPTLSTLGAAKPPKPPALNDEFPELAFRSNGFPTAAVAPYWVAEGPTEGPDDDIWGAKVFVAWQERVDVEDPNSDNFGKPKVFNDQETVPSSPRIVMMRTDADTLGWTGFDPAGGTDDRQAIDLFLRKEPFDPYFANPPNAIFPPNKYDRPAGPQVQPKLSFGGGRLMLTYYESRGRIGNYGSDDDPFPVGSDPEYLEMDPFITDQTPYISGYDRVVDFRATLLEPANGARISSAQISRYPLHIGADLSNGQDLTDVAPVNSPCSPDDGSGYPACVRQVNRVNAPTSAQGTSPFIGDYPDTVPYVQFIPDGAGGWRWAIRPTDVPTRGFHAIWTDNRHLIPPATIPEWGGFQFYGPPGIGGACINSGSRNTDVLTSRVATDVIISSPTTYKQLDRPRSFPFSVTNKTAKFRRFQLDIVSGNGYTTFSREKVDPFDPDSLYKDIDTYIVNVFPYSNSSLTVYATPPGPNPDPILVDVKLLGSTLDPDLGTNHASPIESWDACDPNQQDCLVGTIAFNAYPENSPQQNLDGYDEDFGPDISNAFVINYKPATGSPGDPTAFVINNFLDNAFVINAFVINNVLDNAFVINDGLDNAFVINTEVQNAFVINRNEPVYGISDTVWTMTPNESNTAGTYVPLINVDNASQLKGYYAWQLIIDKNSAYGGLDEECAPYNVAQQQILANVVQDPGDPNAFVINDYVENAFVINPTVDNAFVINSAFALPPAEAGTGSKRLTKGTALGGSGVAAPAPTHEVRITLRAYQLVPDKDLPPNPLTGQPIKHNPAVALPSLTVFHESCDPDVDADCAKTAGADLMIPADPVFDTPLSGHACGEVEFPGFTLRNQGTADAVARPEFQFDEDGEIIRDENGDPIYVDGRLRHAIFLSEDAELEFGVDMPLDGTEFFSLEDPLSGEFDPRRDDLVDPLTDPFEETFDPRWVTLPADLDPLKTYYLIVWVDFPRQASESDETNNTVAVPLQVQALNRPTTMDVDFETHQGTPLQESLTDLVIEDWGYTPLTYQIVDDPTNGTVQILEGDPVQFLYSPLPGFVGEDSFTWTVSYCNVPSDPPAVVTITVINPEWGFVGPQEPWKPDDYAVNAGSAIPIKWYYTDPTTGAKVDSSMEDPQIRIKGRFDCDTGETDQTVLWVNDPGSSDMRYVTGDWQFNWDTVGLGVGCYNIRIFHPYTGQLNGPFQVELK